MTARSCLAIGAVWAAIGVSLGAFGAHALKERLEAADQLANWHTAVRYQVWHALALILIGVLRERRAGLVFPSWGFLVGSLLFSGSIYCLALGVMRPVMGPITPLGGALLISAWLSFAWQVWRAKD